MWFTPPPPPQPERLPLRLARPRRARVPAQRVRAPLLPVRRQRALPRARQQRPLPLLSPPSLRRSPRIHLRFLHLRHSLPHSLRLPRRRASSPSCASSSCPSSLSWT